MEEYAATDTFHWQTLRSFKEDMNHLSPRSIKHMIQNPQNKIKFRSTKDTGRV